jgi:NAD(P)-dependent dehydrogenase (short-subunit alcohol dehydrogenase family)
MPRSKNYMNQSAPTVKLRLENQVAIVTGGSRGIGEGIVRRFFEEGAKVVFSDLLSDKGKASKKNSAKTPLFTGQTLQVPPRPSRS